MVLGSGRSPGFTEPFFVLAHSSPVGMQARCLEVRVRSVQEVFLASRPRDLGASTHGCQPAFSCGAFFSLFLSRTNLQEKTSTLRREIGRVLADAMQSWQDGQVFRTPTLESIQYDARAIAEGNMDVAEYNVDGSPASIEQKERSRGVDVPGPGLWASLVHSTRIWRLVGGPRG